MQEIIINNKKFYYIDKYDFKFGEVYKFSNIDRTIYCFYKDEKFVPIKNNKYLKEINKKIKDYEIKDLV